MNGWIKLHRSLLDCWLWEEKPFDKGRAWIDILLCANHEDKKVNFNGQPIIIGRGQYLTSIRKLAERWGWSYDKVLRFIKILESDGMLQKESNQSRTLLTIVNYGLYQDAPNVDKVTDRTAISEQTERTQVNVPNADRTPTSDKQEVKEREEVKEKDIVGKKPTPPYKTIIDYLNEKTNSRYKHTTKSTQRIINGRFDDGFTLEDFKIVIDVKSSQWLDDKKMAAYLRPETLFAASHFESYLNECRLAKPQEPKHSGISEKLARETSDNLLNTDDCGEFE